MTTGLIRVWALVLGLLFVSAHASAQAPNWITFKDEDVIEVLTHDPDGALRETKVWLGVVDGVGYVRTSDTRWRGNIAADPNVFVRVAGQEYPLRAELVKDASLHARVNDVFRAKYGFSDRLLGWFGNDGGKYCLALVPRPASP